MIEIVFLAFIFACSYFSYKAGHKAGVENGIIATFIKLRADGVELPEYIKKALDNPN